MELLSEKGKREPIRGHLFGDVVVASFALKAYNRVTVAEMIDLPVSGSELRCRMCSFENLPDNCEHVLLVFGDPDNSLAPLVRVHSECLTGDVFGSLRCDCGEQLSNAVKQLKEEGGYLLYLRQEGRGIGLYKKLQAYRLQDQGLDTFEANASLGFDADLRTFTPAAAMLLALGVRRARLLTNNPDKVAQLTANGVDIVERISTPAYINPHNRRYLAAKVGKANHAILLT